MGGRFFFKRKTGSSQKGWVTGGTGKRRRGAFRGGKRGLFQQCPVHLIKKHQGGSRRGKDTFRSVRRLIKRGFLL